MSPKVWNRGNFMVRPKGKNFLGQKGVNRFLNCTCQENATNRARRKIMLFEIRAKRVILFNWCKIYHPCYIVCTSLCYFSLSKMPGLLLNEKIFIFAGKLLFCLQFFWESEFCICSVLNGSYTLRWAAVLRHNKDGAIIGF